MKLLLVIEDRRCRGKTPPIVAGKASGRKRGLVGFGRGRKSSRRRRHHAMDRRLKPRFAKHRRKLARARVRPAHFRQRPRRQPYRFKYRYPFPLSGNCRSIPPRHSVASLQQEKIMAASDPSAKSGSVQPSVLAQVRSALGELFGGGAVGPDMQVALEVAFGLLGALAQADSIVTTHETEFVNALMEEHNLSTHARRIAKESFERGRRRQIDIEAEARRFVARFGKGSSEVERLYDALLRLAAADERLRPREREFLVAVPAALGFEAHALEARLSIIGHGSAAT